MYGRSSICYVHPVIYLGVSSNLSLVFIMFWNYFYIILLYHRMINLTMQDILIINIDSSSTQAEIVVFLDLDY